eukprot:scaffold75203_cov33-Tisochrysis_lutea.AAC.1
MARSGCVRRLASMSASCTRQLTRCGTDICVTYGRRSVRVREGGVREDEGERWRKRGSEVEQAEDGCLGVSCASLPRQLLPVKQSAGFVTPNQGRSTQNTQPPSLVG